MVSPALCNVTIERGYTAKNYTAKNNTNLG